MILSPCKKCLVRACCEEYKNCESYKDYQKTLKKINTIQYYFGLSISFIPLFLLLIFKNIEGRYHIILSCICLITSLFISLTAIKGFK
jgi:hypothetical protein